jgi:hypothetical protein
VVLSHSPCIKLSRPPRCSYVIMAVCMLHHTVGPRLLGRCWSDVAFLTKRGISFNLITSCNYLTRTDKGKYIPFHAMKTAWCRGAQILGARWPCRLNIARWVLSMECDPCDPVGI